MVYRVIVLMSGSSLDGLDVVAAEITENSGAWGFEIVVGLGCSYRAVVLHYWLPFIGA